MWTFGGAHSRQYFLKLLNTSPLYSSYFSDRPDSLSRFSFRNTIYSYAHKSDLKEFSVSSFLGLGQRVPHATARLSQRRYVWPSRFFSRNKKEKSKVFTVFRLRSHKKCPWYWRELVSAKLVNKRDNVENKGGETQRINTNDILFNLNKPKLHISFLYSFFIIIFCSSYDTFLKC